MSRVNSDKHVCILKLGMLADDQHYAPSFPRFNGKEGQVAMYVWCPTLICLTSI